MKFLYGLLLVVLLSPQLAFAATPSIVTNVTIGNTEIVSGEPNKVSFQFNTSKVQAATILLDGQPAFDCQNWKKKKTAVCSFDFKGPFTVWSAGTHVFQLSVLPKKSTEAFIAAAVPFTVTDDKEAVFSIDESIVDGTDEWLVDWKENKKNKFISPKTDTYPEFDKITAKTFQPTVGSKLNLTVWAKNKSELLGMGVYIDEEPPESGIGSICIMCDKTKYPANNGISIGPFKPEDVGEHTFSALLVNKNGKRRVLHGSFSVLP